MQDVVSTLKSITSGSNDMFININEEKRKTQLDINGVYGCIDHLRALDRFLANGNAGHITGSC